MSCSPALKAAISASAAVFTSAGTNAAIGERSTMPSFQPPQYALVAQVPSRTACKVCA
jgi:hypothetical protein